VGRVPRQLRFKKPHSRRNRVETNAEDTAPLLIGANGIGLISLFNSAKALVSQRWNLTQRPFYGKTSPRLHLVMKDLLDALAFCTRLRRSAQSGPCQMTALLRQWRRAPLLPPSPLLLRRATEDYAGMHGALKAIWDRLRLVSGLPSLICALAWTYWHKARQTIPIFVINIS